MKKIKILTITLFFCLLPIPCYAQDYWVYIRTYNRYSITSDDDAGRSKKGDIVDIRPVRTDTEPSEIGKKEWSIIKVSGLTEQDIANYKQRWQEQTGIDNEGNPIYETKTYRKYKIDIDKLNLKIGKNDKVIKYSNIKGYIEEKTDIDLIAYNRGRKWYALTQPIRYAWHSIFRSAYAENISTINKTGEDYDTLTLWEDAKDGDLVTETRQETAECYDDQGDLVDTPNIDGSTTNATYYMKITVPSAERHSGKDGTGFTLAPNNNAGMFIGDDFTVVEWLIIDGAGITGFTKSGIRADLADACIFRNNIIFGFRAPIECGRSGTQEVYNNVLYDAESGYGGLWVTGAGGDANAYNNTIHNCSYGIKDDNDTVLAKNNLIQSSGTSVFNGILDSNSTHNVGEYAESNLAFGATWATGITTSTSTNKLIDSGATFITAGVQVNSVIKNTTDTTYTYVTAVDSETQLSVNADIFVSNEGYSVYKNMYGSATFADEVNDDFHLDSTDTAAIDKGTDLGDGAWDIDIDGRDRDAEGDTWDIGADEYVAAPAAALVHAIINIF